jgi:hypothetical protein
MIMLEKNLKRGSHQKPLNLELQKPTKFQEDTLSCPPISLEPILLVPA